MTASPQCPFLRAFLIIKHFCHPFLPGPPARSEGVVMGASLRLTTSTARWKELQGWGADLESLNHGGHHQSQDWSPASLALDTSHREAKFIQRLLSYHLRFSVSVYVLKEQAARTDRLREKRQLLQGLKDCIPKGNAWLFPTLAPFSFREEGETFYYLP